MSRRAAMEVTIRQRSFHALLPMALLAAPPAAALPAVDGPSGKLMFVHGGSGGDKWTGLEGALTVPLGAAFRPAA